MRLDPLALRLRWMLVTTTVVGTLPCLGSVAIFILILAAILAVLVAVPVILAPRGCRIEVACWAMALHPLVFIAWLALWRLFIQPVPRYPMNFGWYYRLTLEAPYALALLSLLYLPVVTVVTLILAAPRLAPRRMARVSLTASIVWVVILAVVLSDILKMSVWFYI